METYIYYAAFRVDLLI